MIVSNLYLIIQTMLASDRIDSLGPALLSHGRIDRKMEFVEPDVRTKNNIFSNFYFLN